MCVIKMCCVKGQVIEKVNTFTHHAAGTESSKNAGIETGMSVDLMVRVYLDDLKADL